MKLLYLKNNRGAMFLTSEEVLKKHFPEVFFMKDKFSLFLKSETDKQMRFVLPGILSAYIAKANKIYMSNKDGGLVIKVRNFTLRPEKYNCKPYMFIEAYDPIIHDFVDSREMLYDLIY